MTRSRLRLGALAAALALLVALCLAGCGGSTGSPTASRPFRQSDWASVVRAARGQTVNWYVYGGSDAVNRFVDTTYGPALRDRYGIRLHRVPVADTVDAVNEVLSEKQAGVDPGVVDLIWINGENFDTLRQAGMLRTGWSRGLPNARFVEWSNPALNRDFGVPIQGMESPWSSAQIQLVYDPARTPPAGLPRSYARFAAWACGHPGRATYVAPGPGGFIGTRFVKGALDEISGGPARWRTYDTATWRRWSPRLWAYLRALAPCLWRHGQTYPKDENALHSLFANREVDLSLTMDLAGPATLIDAGTLPKDARTYVFDADMIGDYNYVAIPRNAPHPAAALVLANLLLDPSMQAAQARPQSGFGLGFAIDPRRVPDATARADLRRAAADRGPGATPIADLRRALAPDMDPRYQDLIERGWRANVLRG
ncbi:MAG: ABC transporter substrate-binding protein [Thermoleophilia bacterium]